jgi:hypothetical protein
MSVLLIVLLALVMLMFFVIGVIAGKSRDWAKENDFLFFGLSDFRKNGLWARLKRMNRQAKTLEANRVTTKEVDEPDITVISAAPLHNPDTKEVTGEPL